MPDNSPTAEEFASEQAVEYGTWTAKQPITHLGVLAYNIGDPVPVSNVALYGYDRDGLVERTKASPLKKVTSTDTPEKV